MTSAEKLNETCKGISEKLAQVKSNIKSISDSIALVSKWSHLGIDNINDAIHQEAKALYFNW